MDRREALRNTAFMLGYAVSAGTVAAVMGGCTSESVTKAASDASTPARAFFTKDQIQQISAMCETILPETDTPGATEAGVPEFVEVMVGQNFDVIQQTAFTRGLKESGEDCLAIMGKDFVECNDEERLQFMTRLDKESYELLHSDVDMGDFKPFYATLKELTFVGYFTSELIGKNHLNYDPVPGAYHGCMPIEETGPKAWSL